VYEKSNPSAKQENTSIYTYVFSYEAKSIYVLTGSPLHEFFFYHGAKEDYSERSNMKEVFKSVSFYLKKTRINSSYCAATLTSLNIYLEGENIDIVIRT
jgi:hypothetical protein